MTLRRLPERDRRTHTSLPLALWAAVGSLVSVQGVQAFQPVPPEAGADRAKVAVSPHDTVDIHVKDESIANVLELLGVGSQRNIIVSKNVSGKVSADLYNVSFEEALNALLRSNGLDYVQEGRFIYVYTAEEMTELKKRLVKRQGKVLTLSYLSASDAAEFVKPLLSEGGQIKFVGKTPDFNIPSNTPTGADTYALGATMVVIDFPENISAIEQVLTELDTKPKQVLVQSTVLQTKVSEENAFGVDLSIIADTSFTDFLKVGGPLGVANALVTGGDGNDAKGGYSPPGNNAFALGSTPGATAGKSTLKIGVIGGNVAAFVRLLDEVSDTVVLSNPRLLTLNRQPARVLVGERIAYLSTTQTETSQTQTVQFLDTGVQLYVRPFVAPNNQIRLELKPQVSSATIRNIKAGAGEVTVPDETTQEIVTNVIINDGMTVVLGGLFQEATVAARRQVPVIGDIPIIGSAFRGHDDSVDRNELIFLLTPTVMNDSNLLVSGFEAGQTLDRVRAGARQGLLPWSRDRMTSVLNVEAEKLARDGQGDEALWKLQRSLSLNPRQPDALRLRERLTGERENWPVRSLIEDMLDTEIEKRLEAVPPAGNPAPHHRPWGSVEIPREPAAVAPKEPHANAETGVISGAATVTVHAEPTVDHRTLASSLAAKIEPIQPAGSAVTETPADDAQPNGGSPLAAASAATPAIGESNTATALATETLPSGTPASTTAASTIAATDAAPAPTPSAAPSAEPSAWTRPTRFPTTFAHAPSTGLFAWLPGSFWPVPVYLALPETTPSGSAVVTVPTEQP